TFRGTLTYTATISTSGPTSATGVTLVAALPTGANFVSASGAACTRQGKGKSDGTLTCTAGTLATGASQTGTIVVQPTTPGTITPAAKAYPTHPPPHPAKTSATQPTPVAK